MTTTKRVASIAAILIVCLVIFCAATAPGIQGALARSNPAGAEHHYNDDVQDDGITWNDFNFGPNRFEWADKAIKNGDATNVLEYVYTNDGQGNRGGDFIKSINPHDNNPDYDGALLAAVCLHVENKTGMTILVDEQNEPIGKRADAAHLHFHEDRAYAEACYDRLMSILDHAQVHVQEIGSYTSSMYQWYKGLNGNMPSVIVRNSANNGGHALVFDLGEKVGLIRFRLECGYQPIDTDDYWPTPPGPPQPPEPEEPEPDIPLEPKDPDAGPQAQIDPSTPGYEDFGGGPNHDPITEITDEPTAPDEPYVAPKPPEAETPTQPAQPTQPHGQDEPGAATPGHDTDYQGGGTEDYDGGSGNVVVGGSTDEDYDDLTGVVQGDIDGGNTTPEPGLDPGDGSGNDEAGAPE